MRTRSIQLVCAIVLALLLEDPAYAQSQSASTTDTLRVWQSVLSYTGFKYAYGDQSGDVGFGGSNVKKIVNANALALHEVETFGKFQVPSFVTSLASAAALGWGIGSDNNDLVYIGVAGLVVSLVVDQIGYSHLKKGVRIYNDGLE